MPSVQVDQLDLYYRDEGSGPAVVLIHGFPLTLEMWDRQIPVLANGFRVITPDLRGFGRSRHAAESLTMDTYASDVAAVIDHAGVEEPVALAGFSMGGYVSFAFLRAFSQRVRALALVDTKETADTPEAMRGRREMAGRVLASGSRVVADAMIGKLLSAETRAAKPDLEESIHRMMRVQPPDAVAQALAAMGERPDSRPMLSQIRVPTIVIGGEKDEIVTIDEMRSMAEGIAGATLVKIRGAGHLAPMEKPEDVTGVLRGWLSSILR